MTTTHEPEHDGDPQHEDVPDEQREPGGDDAAKARREAARYRTRLREVEQERDALAERVTGMRREAVEHLATGRLAQPGDVWLDGDDLDGLLDGDGRVDPTKVGERVTGLLAARPGLAPPAPEPHEQNRRERLAGGTDPTVDPEGPSWSELLSQR